MELVKLSVRDEENNRVVELSITPQQQIRACNDEIYLRQLIAQHDRIEQAEENTDCVQAARPVDTIEQNSENSLQAASPAEIISDDGSDENSRSIYIWSDACIYLLLSFYEEHKQDFSVKRHKKVFQDIANKMHGINPIYTMSGGQCQSKLNSLKKMYKKIIDHNATSGNDRATWPYFERMHELFGSSGWARPVATASEAGPDMSQGTSGSPNTQKNKRKLDATFEEYVKEKKKQHEEKALAKQEFRNKLLELKERQHKEKMNLLWAIRNSLNNNNNK